MDIQTTYAFGREYSDSVALNEPLPYPDRRERL